MTDLTPPADRAELRDRIAEAIHVDLTAHKARRDQGLLGIVPRLADAVLAVLPASIDRAAVLDDAAAALEAQTCECGCRRGAEFIRQRAAELRRTADETPRAETEATESVIYEVVGDWGVDSADSAEGARAAVAKWLRAWPKCRAFAQQRIVRDWPDGSEYYGPWTDLPEQPAVGAQQPKEA